MMNGKIMRKIYRPGKKPVRAFTLIELLVVIALTVILLTVIFAPLIEAFQFTEQAQATAQAQDAARLVTEQIARELGSAAAVRDTTGNYLDIDLDTKTGGHVVARSYNAYLDIVPPRSQKGSLVDPTVDPNTPTSNLNGSSVTGIGPELSSPGYGLPLSAGSTVVRYFIALRYPINPTYVPGTTANPSSGTAPDNQGGPFTQPGEPQPYVNLWDGLKVASTSPYFQTYVEQKDLNNTYQLYRANFQPYTLQSNGSYGPNTLLFPTVTKNAVAQPILDDPDFFRIVTIGDADAVAGQGDGGVYNSTTAKAHNDRVYNWYKIAKEVISTRDIDLIGLPRAGKSIVYDPATGDPVDSFDANGVPLVRTTINFAPALISNDPMAASTAAYRSQGYGSSPNLLDPSTTSLPYIPTLFQAQYGNWQGTPAVTITKTTTASNGQATLQVLQTRSFAASDGTGYNLGQPNYSSPAATAPAIGDLILASGVTSTSPGTPVYDVTDGAPIVVGAATAPAQAYDSMIIDDTRGVVSFSIPALPSGLPVQTPPNTYFTVNAAGSNGTYAYNVTSGGGLPNQINLGDFQLLPGTPLPAPLTETGGMTNSYAVPNATLVVNSERVVGPDLASGPMGAAPVGDVVQYTRVSSSVPSGPNQYSVNYATNTISFAPNYVPASVQIAFNYQNNSVTPSSGQTPNTVDTIDTIRASYYTAMIMRLNLGVRVYGGATGNSIYFSLNSQVGVGNAKAN
jgi:type II secretory pathway pseudopilin PulG